MMNAELVDRIGWTLIHSVWELTLVVCLAGVFSRTLFRGSATGRYATGLVTLVFLAGVPAITFLVIPSLKSPEATVMEREDRDAARFATSTQSPPAVASGSPSLPADIDRSGIVDSRAPVEAFEPVNTEVARAKEIATRYHLDSQRGTDPQREEAVTRFVRTLQPVLPVVVMVWLAGVSLLSLRPLAGLYTVRRLRRVGRSQVAEGIARTVRSLSERMGIRRRVSVAHSSLLEVPAVIGVMRPLLLLPVSAVSGLSSEQLEAVIAHELAHVRRYDFLVNLVQSFVETVFFYHPAVWWVSRRLREERENCCDDVALEVCGDRSTYASALVTLEQLRSPIAFPVVAASGGPLVRRIRRILYGNQAGSGGLWFNGLVLFAVAAVGLCALLLPEGGTAAEPPRPGFAADEAEREKAEPQPSSPGETSDNTTGALGGRIVIAKPIPPRPPLRPKPGLEVKDSSLLISRDGGLANVVIYLRKAPADWKRTPPPEEPAVLEFRKETLIPHVSIVRVGQDMIWKNSGERTEALRNSPLQSDNRNMVLPPQSHVRLEEPYKRPESFPHEASSNIHPWIRAYILPVDHPFAAVTDADGRYEIKDLPAGEYSFRVWHERAGFLTKNLKVTIHGGKTARESVEYSGDLFARKKREPDAAGDRKPPPGATGSAGPGPGIRLRNGVDPSRTGPNSIGAIPAEAWGGVVNGVKAAISAPKTIRMNEVVTVHLVLRNVSKKTIRLTLPQHPDILSVRRDGSSISYGLTRTGGPVTRWELKPGHQAVIPSRPIQFIAPGDFGLNQARAEIKPGPHTLYARTGSGGHRWIPNGDGTSRRFEPPADEWKGWLSAARWPIEVIGEKVPFSVHALEELPKGHGLNPVIGSPRTLSWPHTEWIELRYGLTFALDSSKDAHWLRDSGTYNRLVCWGPIPASRLAELKLLEPIRQRSAEYLRTAAHNSQIEHRIGVLVRSGKPLAAMGLQFVPSMKLPKPQSPIHSDGLTRTIRDRRVQLKAMGLKEPMQRALAILTKNDPPLPDDSEFEVVASRDVPDALRNDAWGPVNAGLQAAALMPAAITADASQTVRLFIRNVSQNDVRLAVSERAGYDYATAVDEDGVPLKSVRPYVYPSGFASVIVPELNPGQTTQFPPVATLRKIILKPRAVFEVQTVTKLRYHLDGKSRFPGGFTQDGGRPAVTHLTSKPTTAHVTWHLHTANGAIYSRDLKRRLWPARGSWSGILTTAPVAVALRE